MQVNDFTFPAVKHRYDHGRPTLNERNMRQDAGVEDPVHRLLVVKRFLANLANFILLADFVVFCHGNSFSSKKHGCQVHGDDGYKHDADQVQREAGTRHLRNR